MKNWLLYNLQRLREEELSFKVILDSDLAKEHAADIAVVLNGKVPTSGDGDTLVVSYNLKIQYWDNIAEQLQALCRILDNPDAIISVDTKELRHGYCVIEHLFNQLSVIKQTMSKRLGESGQEDKE